MNDLEKQRKDILDAQAQYDDWYAEPDLKFSDYAIIFLFLIILFVIFAFGGELLQNVMNYLRAN